MKSVTILCFLFFAWPFACFANGEENQCLILHLTISSARNSIENHYYKESSGKSKTLSPGVFVEFRNESLEKFEEFRTLQQYIQTRKIECLPCLEIAVRDPADHTLFFKAAQVLNREEYIQLVEAASDLAESGTISKQQYKWALWPFSKHLRDMWAEDPVSKPLQQLAMRAKTVMADDPSCCIFFDNILSRKLASPSAPRQTIPPLDDGSIQRDITKAPVQSSPEIRTTPINPDRSLSLWPWLIAAILVIFIMGGIWRYITHK